MDRGAWWATTHGVTRVGHNLATKASSLKRHNIISFSSRYDTASGAFSLICAHHFPIEFSVRNPVFTCFLKELSCALTEFHACGDSDPP